MKKEKCIVIIIVMMMSCLGYVPSANVVDTITVIEDGVSEVDEMTIYNYKKVNDVENDKYPSSSWLVCESDSALYFVNSIDLYKTLDEGETVTSIYNVGVGANFMGFFYDQTNEFLYVSAYTDVSWVEKFDLSDDSHAQVGANFNGIVGDVFIIGSDLFCLVLYSSDSTLHFYKWVDPNWVDQAQIVLLTSTSFITIIGTDAWFTMDDGSDTILYKFIPSGPTISSMDTITSRILSSTSQAIAYDGSDVLYFTLLNGATKKLYSYSITSDTSTELAQFDVVLMPERMTNSSNAIPFNLEKGFHLTSLYIYQIPRMNEGRLWKISDLTNAGINTGTIVAITDTYLFIKETDGNIELWKFQDISTAIISARITHYERDYPTMKLEYNSDVLHLEDGMFVQVIGNVRVKGSTSVGVKFEGYIIKPEDDDEEAVVIKVVDLVSPAYYDLTKSPLASISFTGDSDAFIDLLDADFDYITKGTYDDGQALDNMTLETEKNNAQFLDELAVGDTGTWGLNFTGVLDYVILANDSGIDYTQATPIWDVLVSKRSIVYNQIQVKGAYVKGTIIESALDHPGANNYPDQQENGIQRKEITIAWIQTVATANLYATALLTNLSANYTEIKFKVRDTTNGPIPPTEQVTLTYTHKSITAAQYWITKVIHDDKSLITEYTVCSAVKWDVGDFENKVDVSNADQIGQLAASALTGDNISDTAYGAAWNAVTTIAPSKNVVYDEMETKTTAAEAVAAVEAAGISIATTKLLAFADGGSANLIIDDDSMATATATSLSSSESVKAYVDKGNYLEYDDDDSASWDISQANITIDGAWHEIDLDTYKTVPSDAIGMVARIEVIETAGTIVYALFRSTSQANSVQNPVLMVQANHANQSMRLECECTIPLDANHKFDYLVPAGLNNFGLSVLWWIRGY